MTLRSDRIKKLLNQSLKNQFIRERVKLNLVFNLQYNLLNLLHRAYII